MLYLAWLYGILLFADIGLLLAQLYFIIMYSDLEADYTNPMELCETMDFALPLEAYAQGALTAILLFSGEWFSFLLFAPCVLYNVYQYTQTKLRFDATTIFKTVRKHRVESIVKLVYYFITFCYLLYCMIWSLVRYADGE